MRGAAVLKGRIGMLKKLEELGKDMPGIKRKKDASAKIGQEEN